MNLKERLKRAIAFDEQPTKEDWCGERAASDYNSYCVGVRRENKRLQPILAALIECAEVLNNVADYGGFPQGQSRRSEAKRALAKLEEVIK